MAWTPTFSPGVSSALGTAGAMGGAGFGLGGVVGGIHGAVKGYREARDQGADVGHAAVSGLMGAGHSAYRGALAGGALGIAGGAATGALSSGAGERVRSALSNGPGPVGSFSRFGQRQVHSLTGWQPAGGLAELRMGATTRQGAVDAAKNAIHSGERTWGDKLHGRSAEEIVKHRTGKFDAAVASQAALQHAEDQGLTHIPGYLHSMKHNGVLNTLRDSAATTWNGASNFDKAMVAMPVASAAMAAVKGKDDQPDALGQYKGQRIAGHLASGLSYAALAPMSMGVSGLLGTGAHQVASTIGRGIDRLRGKPSGHVMAPRPQDLTSDSGQSVPGERVVSERAAGSMGEGSPS